jgi:serine/threonine protein kinase
VLVVGSVHKGRWISKNRPVACKIITVRNSNQTDHLEESFFKELAAYMELSGGYILKTYGYALFQHGNSKKYMIIMEYMARGSLANVLKNKDEKISLRRKVHIARQIASGMRKIHEHHMIHRDIRSDNILVSQNYTAKIGDMGIARVVDPFNQHTQIGCAPFMPPEFRCGTYDQKLDIFTFGLTLNELFTEIQHHFRPLANEKIVFRVESPVFPDLITRCTANDPKHRPAAIEIEKTLELYSQGFDHIVLKENLAYINLSTERKNEIFIKFYEKFHAPATEFIRKKFPPEFLNGPTSIAGVKVDKDTDKKLQIECPLQ